MKHRPPDAVSDEFIESCVYKPENPRFNGADYVPERDNSRLKSQLDRVRSCMTDGEWRTLEQISAITGDPPASISAQLRHLRKDRFGAHTVNRKHEGNGLYKYQLILNRGGAYDN